MLEHIGQRETVRRIKELARSKRCGAARGLRRDLGGDGTTAIADAGTHCEPGVTGFSAGRKAIMSLRVTLVQGGGMGSGSGPSGPNGIRRLPAWIFSGTNTSPATPPSNTAHLRCRRPCWTPCAAMVWPSKPSCWWHRTNRAITTSSFAVTLGLFASVRPLKNLKGLPAVLRRRGHSRYPRTDRRPVYRHRT